MDTARILITGSTGFVGRHLVRHLLSSPEPKITLAVRGSNGLPESWHGDTRIRIVETGQIETSTNLAEALLDVSSVIHLAGLAHVTRSSSSNAFAEANGLATQRLSEAAAKQGVRSFIHLSSLAAVTKNASTRTIDDTTSEPASTPYGRSKREAESHVSSLANQAIFAVSLRPPLVVGNDAKGNWGSLQRLAATGIPLPLSTATNRRSLISVRSLAEAIECLCSTDWSPEKSGNYCVADESPLSIPTIIRLLRAGMGLPSRLFPFPPNVLSAVAKAAGREYMASGLLGDLSVDASRFHRAFGFKPSQGIEQAITESGRLYHHIAAQNGTSQ